MILGVLLALVLAVVWWFFFIQPRRSLVENKLFCQLRHIGVYTDYLISKRRVIRDCQSHFRVQRKKGFCLCIKACAPGIIGLLRSQCFVYIFSGYSFSILDITAGS